MKKNYLITSALPYVNGPLHLGHLIGCLLPADVYARFCRANGRNTIYICGADEHGTPVEAAARAEGVDPAKYADGWYQIQRGLLESFDISTDYYGRTHTPQHEKLIHEIFKHLDDNGFIEERTTIQPYSVNENIWLVDRFVVGTCPKCGFEGARGDQCDKCSELLDPKDLINPRSISDPNSPVELRETQHLFFLLTKAEPLLRKWLSTRVGWSKTAMAIANKWLAEGLHDQPITRDFKWGVSVPKPGFESKVFYVWLDAPWGYISISQVYAEIAGFDWRDFWKGDENTHYVQFMGKDNVSFHSVFFPSYELACNDYWKTVDVLKGMNFLNFEGDKISKSTGNGIFLGDAISEYPADYWKYYLISNAPESDDSDLTVARFADVINKDLNDILGNFISRITKFTEKKLGLVVPAAGEVSDLEIELDKTINDNLSELTNAIESCEFRRAGVALRALWATGNEYITRAEPWAIIKTDPIRAEVILRTCFQLMDFYSRISAPFIPNSVEKIRAIFGSRHDLSWPTSFEKRVKAGDEFIVPENIFEKIMPERVEELRIKYSRKG